MGVDAVVERVRVVAQVGAHAVRENAAVAPVGSPETVKATACTLSESRVAVIALETAARSEERRVGKVGKAQSKGGEGAANVKAKLVVRVRPAVAGAVTVKLKLVVRVTPPPVSVTVRV